MITEPLANQPVTREARKLITCILPDDLTHRTLLRALRSKNQNQVFSQSCLGVDLFADAKVRPGTLPDAYLVRIVQIVAQIEEADELFNYVYEIAQIDRPGGGLIMQAPLTAATHYELPEGVPDE